MLVKLYKKHISQQRESWLQLHNLPAVQRACQQSAAVISTRGEAAREALHKGAHELCMDAGLSPSTCDVNGNTVKQAVWELSL